MSLRDSLPEVILMREEPDLAASRPSDDAPREVRDAWYAEHVQCRAVGAFGRCRYGVRQPHRDVCVVCAGPLDAVALAAAALAAAPRRVASSLDGVPRSAWPEEKIGGEVQLSNKACPRYYVGVPRRCSCPEGQCWYDAQLARRARVLPALTPDAWLALLAGEIVDPE